MDDKKYVRVIFQLEPDRHEFIKQEAEKKGLSISQYLRNLVREKYYSGRFTSMVEEQRQERIDDGFEQDHIAMLDKLRSKFSDSSTGFKSEDEFPVKYDSLTGMRL
tara:strand:+ start:979 stop:1296 length:318 start_codon:yes stop_codon:yes gene_type:complete